MRNLLDDLRFAFRGLRNHAAHTALAVLTIALGIGANTAIFSAVHALLLRPLPYRAPHEIVWITSHIPQFNADIAGGGDYLEWRDRARTLSSLAAYDADGAVTLTGRGEPQRVHSARVTDSFLPLLGVRPDVGRGFGPDDVRLNAAPIVLLTAGAWRRWFGSGVALRGQTIRLDGRMHAVVGVLPSSFVFPGRPALDVLRPMAFDEAVERGRGQMSIVSILGRLAPGATLDAVRRELQAIRNTASEAAQGSAHEIRELPVPAAGPVGDVRAPAPGAPPLERGEPASEVRVAPLRTRLVGDAGATLLLLMATVAVILLMACGNVANLVLARAARQRHELSVRAALGASPACLVRQLFVESLVLALLGGALGVALAYPLLAAIVSRVPTGVASGLFQQLPIDLDVTVLAFTLLLSTTAAVLFGLGPAVLASRVNLNDALRDSSRQIAGGPSRRRLRRLLIVGEVALTAVLLVGAGLLVRSFGRLLAVDPGFQPARVVAVGMEKTLDRDDGPDALRAFYKEVIERVSAIPGVAAAAVGDTVPLREFTRFHIGLRAQGSGPVPDRAPEIAVSAVSAGYFNVMGMRLAAGRLFDAGDRENAPRVAVVNQRMARQLWGSEAAVGRRVQVDPGQADWITIVGVVGNVRHDGLDAEPRAAMYVPFPQEPEPRAFLVVRTTGEPAAVVRDVKRAIQELDPSLAVRDVATMEQRLAESVAARRFTLLLVSMFAGLAVALASVGLYGVLSSSIAERTREIGIRVALGAQPADLRRRVVGEGLALVMGGGAIGLLAARAFSRGLAASLVGVTPGDPLTFAGIGALLLAVGLFAAAAPAIRATRIDPLEALQND